MPIATIALGANLGNPSSSFDWACRRLERLSVTVLARSRLYRSRPWGRADQPCFTNAAIEVHTSMRPLELLHQLRGIENLAGRLRREPWGPRRLDLDLIVLGKIEMDHPELVLPHPRWLDRDFVIAPILDLQRRGSSTNALPPVGELGRRLSCVERFIESIRPWT